jgi:hypothetical protein
MGSLIIDQSDVDDDEAASFNFDCSFKLQIGYKMFVVVFIATPYHWSFGNPYHSGTTAICTQ